MGALVVLAAQAGSIEPGAEAETVVLVRNTGDAADTFHVVLQGDASSWAVVDPPQVSLGPGEEAPVWVHFRPPRSPDTRPGSASFAVAVASTTDPDFVAVETGELAIGTFSSLTASFVGEPTLGSKFVEVEVAVRNTGNRKVQVDVAAESLDPRVRFEVEPSVIDLPPGQPVNVAVRVRPPRRVLPGRTRDREITVTVVSDGGAFAALRTEYPDDPTLADELIRSARVLAVLLVLLFVGGVALLRSESSSGTVAVTQDDDVTLPTVVTTLPPEEGEGAVDATAPEATEGAPVDTSPAPSTAPKPAPTPPLPPLAFIRVYGPADRDIVVRDRGRELRLRVAGSLESRPRVAPDGRHVAYVSERGGAWRICVIPSGGGDPVCLVDTTSNAAVAWAADGQGLFFSRAGALLFVPYDVETQTAGPEVDRNIAVPNGNFGISPDRTRIVVADGRRLAVRHLDGSAGVTIDVGAPQDPSFSPDGSRIVYAADLQIFTVPAAGGTIRQLTSPGTVNGEPAWTGDGDWVVFRSNRSGNGDLYAVKGGGGSGEEQGLAQVTFSDEREVTPAF